MIAVSYLALISVCAQPSSWELVGPGTIAVGLLLCGQSSGQIPPGGNPVLFHPSPLLSCRCMISRLPGIVPHLWEVPQLPLLIFICLHGPSAWCQPHHMLLTTWFSHQYSHTVQELPAQHFLVAWFYLAPNPEFGISRNSMKEWGAKRRGTTSSLEEGRKEGRDKIKKM